MPEDTKKFKILMILGICVTAAGFLLCVTVAGFGLWGWLGNKQVKVASSGKVNIADYADYIDIGNFPTYSVSKVKFA